ncbi:DUF1203 domain-containing protein [Lacrimispora sp. 38-1]|uniref:DUF1203 domain-containing protein n=1 Tax=Lacrimispora sp. 38-1 TaxID=3125778 RepID=UPI003CF3CB85
MYDFRIRGLEKSEFQYLNDLSDEELENKGVVKIVADTSPGYPCRVSLEDAKVGETVYLLNYNHHVANSPYQGNGAIFVRKNAETAKIAVNAIPDQVLQRKLSIRGYDKSGMMLKCKLIDGIDIKSCIIDFFSNEKIEYIHIHNAVPGCYSCLVERVR